MSFLIAGKHGLTQEMEYVVKAKIPRKLLEKTGISKAANNAWDAIAKAANKKGANNRPFFIDCLLPAENYS